MKRHYRSISICLVLVLLLSVFPVHISAAYRGSDYTTGVLAERLDTIIQSGISGCVTPSIPAVGKRMNISTEYHITYANEKGMAKEFQCVAYARAAYSYLFGYNCATDKYRITFDAKAKNNLSYSEFVDWGVKCGAYLRTTNSSAGAWNPDVGHSIIILSYNSNGVTTLEGNKDGNGSIEISTYSWSKFNSHAFSDMKRYVCSFSQPLQSIYDSLGVMQDGDSKPIPSNEYHIYAYCGKLIEVADSKTNDGANVQIWDKSNRNLGCQKFNITQSGSYYTITAVHSGKALDVEDGSSASGTNVWQWHVNGTSAQQWTFEDAGNGYVYIRSALGTYLDVQDNGTANGTNVWAYDYNGSVAQMFKIINAETGQLAGFGLNGGSNSQNNESAQSQAATRMEPYASILYAPEGNYVNVQWHKIPGADHYEIDLAEVKDSTVSFGYTMFGTGKVSSAGTSGILQYAFENVTDGMYRAFVYAKQGDNEKAAEYSDVITVVTKHTHTLQHYAAVEPTCTKNGTIEHWRCSDCGKYFSDANAANEISAAATSVSPLGHNYINGVCSRCGAKDPGYAAPVQGDGSGVSFDRYNVYHQGQFNDVPANQWFTDSVAEAYEFGLMKGSSSDEFNPYGDVTLAEAITMASRIHSIYTNGYEDFDQSTGSAWYQTYLDYAYSNGIIARKFYNTDVTKKATRAQFAEIFANSLPEEALETISNISDNAIPDVKSGDSFAPYVYRLYRAGILTGGDATGTFSPQTYITRAESAAIVSRMAESDNRVQFSLR